MRLPPAAQIERDALAMPQVREGCEFVAAEVVRDCEDVGYDRAWDTATYISKIRKHPALVGPGQRVVAEDPKSTWIEEGTGIYGPTHQPIRPKRGKFLVFPVRTTFTSQPLTTWAKGRHEGDLIFARQVKGRKASHVMRDGSKRTAERLGLRWRNLRDR